ncbi:MAG: N-acetylmuramoyl-L-alanine amidase [Thermomicrobiales bacterium]|nr:N-acetylmuramoyl-L-alanine amidase [Thermomicrobiales bacterium]
MKIDPTTVPLLGPPTATAAQALAYARARGAQRPQEVAAFIAELWRLGTAAGYDPAVVFAQFCDETGVGGSAAWVSRLNPGGLGVTDAGDQGIGFRTGTDAARAMLTHLSTYVRGYDPAFWRYIDLDARYLEPLKRGWGASVRALADLGGGKWATNPRYAAQIADHLAAIRVIAPEGAAASAPTGSGGATRPAEPPPGLIWFGTGNFHPRPEGQRPEAIVFHVTDDLSFSNVRTHFQNPGSRASAHFVVDRDGAIGQFVATIHAAWTNGDIANPRPDLPWLVGAVARCHDPALRPTARGNLNDFCVTIESVGKPGQPFPAAQVERVAALTRYLLARYPTILPRRGRLLRHSDINAVSRGYCPGPSFPLRDIILAVGGDPNDLS